MKAVPFKERSVRDAILHHIANPPVNSRVFDIEPDDAMWIIESFNTDNRSKKPAKIKLFSASLSSGAWWLTGDSLKFSPNGRLLDGQNRLFACIQSGKTLKTHIVFGVPEEAFPYMDQGKPRDGGDILTIAKFGNSKALAAAVRWTRLIEDGRAKMRDTFQPNEILHMLQERYPTLPDFIVPARRIYEVTHCPISLTAAILFLADRINSAAQQEFAHAWELSGQGARGKPIRLMLDEIGRLHSASRGRVHDTVRAALAVKAWNLFHSGRKGIKADMDWQPQHDFPLMEGLSRVQ